MRALDKTLLASALALCAGACYRGGSRPVEMSQLTASPDWITLTRVPTLVQDGEHDCGAAATAMVLDYWGQKVEPEEIRKQSGVPDDKGISAGFLRDYLRGRGLQAYLLEGTMNDLARELREGRPVLVGVAKPYTTGTYAHYQVVVAINLSSKELAVIDPADGWREYAFLDFAKEWAAVHALTLVVSPPSVSLLFSRPAPEGASVACAECVGSLH